MNVLVMSSRQRCHLLYLSLYTCRSLQAILREANCLAFACLYCQLASTQVSQSFPIFRLEVALTFVAALVVLSILAVPAYVYNVVVGFEPADPVWAERHLL